MINKTHTAPTVCMQVSRFIVCQLALKEAFSFCIFQSIRNSPARKEKGVRDTGRRVILEGIESEVVWVDAKSVPVTGKDQTLDLSVSALNRLYAR